MDTDLIYTNESFWLVIPDVTLDSVPVTSLGQVDSFTYEVLGQGITGNMLPSAIPGTWEAEIAGIPVAGRHILRAIATKGNSQGVWEVFQWIHKRS